jgi:hypothetical protein
MNSNVLFHSYGNGRNGYDDRGDYSCTVKNVDGKSKDEILASEVGVCATEWPYQSLRTTGREVRVLAKYLPALAR